MTAKQEHTVITPSNALKVLHSTRQLTFYINFTLLNWRCLIRRKKRQVVERRASCGMKERKS